MADDPTPRLKIDTGIFGIDGEYDLEMEFSNRELHEIKQITGLRLGEFNAAINVGDNDLVVALAMVALARAGRKDFADAVWDAPAGKITMLMDEAEADSLPPVSGPPESGNNESGSGPSGSDSSDGSDGHQETSPASTGSLRLATGATSVSET